MEVMAAMVDTEEVTVTLVATEHQDMAVTMGITKNDP
jgi:hypothetical protein